MPHHISKNLQLMERTLFFCLLVLTYFSLKAQTNEITLTYLPSSGEVVEYAKSKGIIVPCPDVKTDNKTKKTTAAWHQTNMEWIKDYCKPTNFEIEKDYLKIFPEMADTPLDEQPYIAMSWRLTGENGETVLHCYLRMPADEVTNLWLTGEEACLLDRETFVFNDTATTEIYTYRKHFDIKAKKGDVIDLKIIFPPLPATTKVVTIYGVPNWSLMGTTVPIRYEVHGTLTYQTYDTIPQFHKPSTKLEHMYENKPYDRQNWNTWKVLTDAHLVKPLQDGEMALWRTPDATYVAVGYEQNWTTEYFDFRRGTMLVDEAGRQYKLREIQGAPKDELFFMEGCSGDYVAFLLVFDPLPLTVSTITYSEPDGEPFGAWGANWSGTVVPNISIQQLRENQRLFDYHPRIVVK